MSKSKRDRICINCKNKIDRQAYNSTQWCSHRCKKQWRLGSKFEILANGEKLICETCGKEHEGPIGEGRFCSMSCASNFANVVVSRKNLEQLKKEIAANELDGELIDTDSFLGTFTLRKKCKTCKNTYDLCKFQHRRQETCSHICNGPEISKLLTLSYSNGRRKIHGGRTVWQSVETSQGTIRVQGSYEKRALKILEALKEKREIDDWEYHTLKIPYTGADGKIHTYFPDFLVVVNGKRKIVEVKGWQQTKDRLKWNEAKKIFEIDVWYQKDLEKMEKVLNLA